MKYYSELLKKFYDSEKECAVAEKEERARVEKAEKEAAAKANLRKIKADKVEEARKALVEAQKNYQEILADFCKDYPEGYHTTVSLKDLSDIANFFNWLW